MHKCPAARCRVQVSRDKLMCRQHWLMVPAALRNEVYDTWDYGRGEGSEAHWSACVDAIDAVNMLLE